MPATPVATRPAARLALAFLGGVLVALSMPPWGWWPLSFVGIACFSWSASAVVTRRHRAWLGFVFALPWMAIGMAWMWFLTAPGYVVTAVLFAGLHGGAAAIAPGGRWAVIGRPAAHTLAEVVRMVVPFGGVPLATLGIAQAGGPLLGLSRLGGVVLITWFVFQAGAALVATCLRSRRPDRLRREPVAFAALGLAVVVVGTAVSPQGADRDLAPVTIAAVQGGGEQGTSALDVPSSRVTEAHLAATATIEPGPDLDLVVWPENGIDVDDEPFESSVAYGLVAAEAERLGVPMSVGVTIDSEFSANPADGGFVNAQVLVYPDGRVGESYEKVRIVPFGEYVPLRGALEALGAPLDQIPSDAIRGRDSAVVETDDGLTLGVMISWEVFFGDRGRAAGDAEILINPTNGASYTGTIVQTQQVASSKLRAVETGRWVVQVSPTGFSAFVSPDGDVFQRTDVSERRVITMDVPRRTGTTWYGALGDVPWIGVVVIAFALAWWRSRSDLDEEGDGTVVDDGDPHLRAEATRGDDGAVLA